eukprot:TRINITY_DN16338_c0_g1_i1.p1 TRINITY_DN16338_c0_g1~~TRINITY_DN16338_c0_g1_i1.p1  ORF type:complete len:229 (+),score=55.54 TRINITY_DN16338_c0_g1_i1:52-687(+)
MANVLRILSDEHPARRGILLPIANTNVRVGPTARAVAAKIGFRQVDLWSLEDPKAALVDEDKDPTTLVLGEKMGVTEKLSEYLGSCLVVYAKKRNDLPNKASPARQVTNTHTHTPLPPSYPELVERLRQAEAENEERRKECDGLLQSVATLSSIFKEQQQGMCILNTKIGTIDAKVDLLINRLFPHGFGSDSPPQESSPDSPPLPPAPGTP